MWNSKSTMRVALQCLAVPCRTWRPRSIGFTRPRPPQTTRQMLHRAQRVAAERITVLLLKWLGRGKFAEIGAGSIFGWVLLRAAIASEGKQCNQMIQMQQDTKTRFCEVLCWWWFCTHDWLWTAGERGWHCVARFGTVTGAQDGHQASSLESRVSSLVESRRVSSSRVVQVPCTGSLYESRIVRAAEPSVQERVCSILSCIRSLERQAHLAPLPLKAPSGQRGQGNIQCHLSVDVEGNVRKPMDLNPITKPHNDHSLSKTPFLTCTYHRRSWEGTIDLRSF